MSSNYSPSAVASRLRGLIDGQDHGMIESAARRLGVSEAALRISIDELAPQPTLEVLVAAVRAYGVDPAWLVTGAYDGAVHRAAVADEAAVTEADLAQLVGRAMTPAHGTQTVARPPLWLEA